MIRQDFFGSVQNVKSSLVLISLESLEKLLGFNCSEVSDDPDELEAFAEKSIDKLAVFVDKIKDAGGDIISMDISREGEDLQVIKKHTVDNEGHNQTILEIRPSKLDMTRFLMKGEPTSIEYFSNRIKELGLSTAQLFENNFALHNGIINEYKALVQS